MITIRGRVGRHTGDGGRNCQNWSDDQKTVADLLNGIRTRDGGAGGAIDARFINGIAGDSLYRAISRFEDQYFPGQRSGFVDPAGAMLKRIEDVHERWTSSLDYLNSIRTPEKPNTETPLDKLRRNLEDDPIWYSRYPHNRKHYEFEKSERVAIAPLITMCTKHVDALKELGRTTLPWRAEIFGRAHVLASGDSGIIRFQTTISSTLFGRRKPIVYSGEDEHEVALPEMNMDTRSTRWRRSIPNT